MPKIIYLFEYFRDNMNNWNYALTNNVLDYLSFRDLQLLQNQKKLFLKNKEFTTIYNKRGKEYLKKIKTTLLTSTHPNNKYILWIYTVDLENFSANFEFKIPIKNLGFHVEFGIHRVSFSYCQDKGWIVTVPDGNQYKKVVTLKLKIYPTQKTVKVIIVTQSQSICETKLIVFKTTNFKINFGISENAFAPTDIFLIE